MTVPKAYSVSSSRRSGTAQGGREVLLLVQLPLSLDFLVNRVAMPGLQRSQHTEQKGIVF